MKKQVSATGKANVYENVFSKNDQALDMYNMMSTVPDDIATAVRDLHGYNLADREHRDIQQIKQSVLAAVRDEILQLSPEYTGVLTPGGSGANEMALHIARNTTQRRKVLVSNLAHISIVDACEKLSLEPCVYAHGNSNELESLLKQDTDTIAAAVISAPDTQLGIVEAIDSTLLKFAKQHGVHMHLDAAYGSFWMTLHSKTRKEMHRVLHQHWDSITADPHKFVGFPNCGTLFLRTQSALDSVNTKNLPYFRATPERYFGSTQKPDGLVSAYLHMHSLGMDGMQARAEQSVAHADFLVHQLQNYDFSLLSPVTASIVPIALSSAEEVERCKNALMQKGYALSPITIENAKSTMYGLRTVLTSQPFYSEQFLAGFVQDLVSVRKKRSSGYF